MRRSYGNAFSHYNTPYRRPRQTVEAAAIGRFNRSFVRGPYVNPRRPGLYRRGGAGYTRTGGYYGRFGQTAKRLGNIAERKFFDTALAFSLDATPEVPATGQLVLIPQGDTESTRDGRQCTVESIRILADLVFTPGAAATASLVSTIILVQDTQTNGAAALPGDVYLGGVANLTYANINLANSSRFKILKKWTHLWNPQAGATTAYNTIVKHIDWYKRCRIPLVYSSTAGAITELRTNNLFLLAQSNGADDIVTVAGTCRIRFRG